MSGAVREWLSACASAVAAEDGASLAAALSRPPAVPASASAASVADAVSGAFAPGDAWHGVLCAQLTPGVAAGGEAPAFEAAHGALTRALDAVQASGDNWLVPALHVLVRRAVASVRALEASLRARGVREGAPQQLNSLVTTLRTAFASTLNHRLPAARLASSKKWGALAIANAIFGIYFRADTLRQCKSIQAGVESAGFPPLAAFPRAQLVTFRYYTGMLAACEDDYGRALAALSAAFVGCHARYAANVRRALRMLVPVALAATGRTPPPALLAAHGLAGAYGDLVAAFRAGDIRRYNATVAANRDLYIRTGVYLVVERLQLLVYRTLFKKVCAMLAAITGSVQIKLARVPAGVRAAGAADDVDVDEVECLLANLIHRKLIRGYLAQKSRVLVLAKTNAFRPLPELLAAQHAAGAEA